MHNTLTFEKLSWAAFMARVFRESGPSAYMSIYEDTAFRNKLAHNPAALALGEIRFTLIDGFLNKWRSRFPSNDKSAGEIREALIAISPHVQASLGLRLETVNLDATMESGEYAGSISAFASAVFAKLAFRSFGYYTTVAAKIMGILNPDLFVMWDDPIALHYGEGNGKAASPDGYADFLRKTQTLARQCVDDFEKRFGHRDPAAYLSSRLELSSPLPLAKFIDEYNWITISNRITVPPRWHPCDDN